MTRKTLATITLAASCVMASFANATVVEFQTRTSADNFKVHLYDHDPAVKATVDNFLKYVRGDAAEQGYGSYENTIIHRSQKDFVLQGGSFVYPGELPLESVTAGPSITNQPLYSNRKYTIAMAKIPGRVHSATSSWFINIADNSGNLDWNEEGFTVFGEVDANDTDVIDALAAINRFDMGGAFNTIPLVNYTREDLLNNVEIGEDNFVFADVVVIDDNPNSSANLTPVKRGPAPEKDDDSSGSMNLLLLSLLSLLALGRKYRFNKA